MLLSICYFLKLGNNKPLQKTQEIWETVLLQNFFLKVNGKGIYFIWMKLKSRKTESKKKKRVKVSLEKYVGMFRIVGTK